MVTSGKPKVRATSVQNFLNLADMGSRFLDPYEDEAILSHAQECAGLLVHNTDWRRLYPVCAQMF